MSATRVFNPAHFDFLPLGTWFYLDAIWGGPSCFAGGRLKFKKVGWFKGANGKIVVEVDPEETVWVRDYNADVSKTVRVPRFKAKA